MAAITSQVPAFTMEQLVAGHTPSTCSLLDYVHHGNFLAIAINEDVVRNTHLSELFILDSRITFAWDWMMHEGSKYLSDITQYVGPYGSSSFVKATEEIGIAPELWLPYIGVGMVANYIVPLTQPAPLDDVIRYARRAQDHLRRLYGFAALLRRLTVGCNTIFECPENSTNWQHHALHCDADILPLIDVINDDATSDYAISLEEAKSLATEQMVLADQLHEDVGTLHKQLAQQEQAFALLQKELEAITSERDALQTEPGRAKSAVSRSLRRLRNAEEYISALQEDNFSNFVQAPLPDHDSVFFVSSTSSHSPPYAHISTPDTSDNDVDKKDLESL
ncbi:hypothetical protein FS837_005891 [Tulasnella sp. UAMH 9824]|nr:hypothetical protein FS837_005891 [Tulasnella sp. UAMH 9824]